MKSIRRQISTPTTVRNSSVFIRLTNVSWYDATRLLSTEYIHLTANSIARRQLIILASASISKMSSAETATSAKDANRGSDWRKVKLVIVWLPQIK